ncbi:MAG: glycosyltransferase [Chitinophagaceae bacterium]
MRILFNTVLLPGIHSEEYLDYLSEVVRHLADKHTGHNFFVICTKKNEHLFNTQDKIELIIVKELQRSVLSWKLWLDVRVPSLLKKYKADLIFSNSFCSLRTTCKQIILLDELNFDSNEKNFSKSQRSFYLKRIAKSIPIASFITTFSLYAKEELTRKYKLSSDKINVIPIIVSDRYKPATDQEKQRIKTTYSKGKEFFLYTGAINNAANLVNLLKAFSLFKKRQQSGFQLLICTTDTAIDAAILNLLDTYKYKADVQLIKNLPVDVCAALMASAYAVVYPVLTNGLILPFFQATQCHVPAILNDSPFIRAIAGEVSLYVDAANSQDIAERMMQIYKDERLRSELINHEGLLTGKYDVQSQIDGFWGVLQKALL